MSENSMKVCKTPVTQSIAKAMMTAATPKPVSTTHVKQSPASTIPTAVKIIFVPSLTRKIQERTSVKQSTVLPITLASSTTMKNAKRENVFARKTNVNHNSVSNLNTVQD